MHSLHDGHVVPHCVAPFVELGGCREGKGLRQQSRVEPGLGRLQAEALARRALIRLTKAERQFLREHPDVQAGLATLLETPNDWAALSQEVPALVQPLRATLRHALMEGRRERQRSI